MIGQLEPRRRSVAPRDDTNDPGGLWWQLRRPIRRLRFQLFGYVLMCFFRHKRTINFLRKRYPVVRLPLLGSWLVTRHVDVTRALKMDQEFTVEPYAAKMEPLVCRFLLGRNGLQHHSERKVLDCAVRPEDVEKVKRLSREYAEQRLTLADGRIDAIGELTDPVVSATISECLGIPPPAAGSVMGWAREVFHDVFLNTQGDDEVHRRADRAARELHTYLNLSIESRLKELDHEQPHAVVLDRLLVGLRDQEQPFLERGRLEESLFGIIIAWAVSVSRAMGRGLDELLRPQRAGYLYEAARAARARNSASVERYLLEALRFNPQAPLVERLCKTGAAMSPASRRETTIPQNARVILHIGSAMMDDDAPDLAEPSQFRVDRPPAAYLHFGHGLHSCFGEEIARKQMTAIAMALFTKRQLGRAGKLEKKGPFPRRLDVTFLP